MQSNEPALDLITQGVTLMKLQKYSDACDMFRLALEQDPENFDAYIHLGNAYVNLNELNEAITAFKSALILDKDSGQALFSLANVYYLLDDNKNAIKNYVKAENVGYHSADMYVIMGNIFYSAGDTVQALRYVSRAVKEQPLRGDLWRQKILLELELEHVDAALETLDEFESILPEALDIHELRTRILLDLKRYDEAREHLAKALMVFPDDMRLRLLKIQLEIADEHPEAAALLLGGKAEQLHAVLLDPQVGQQGDLLPTAGQTGKGVGRGGALVADAAGFHHAVGGGHLAQQPGNAVNHVFFSL